MSNTQQPEEAQTTSVPEDTEGHRVMRYKGAEPQDSFAARNAEDSFAARNAEDSFAARNSGDEDTEGHVRRFN